MKKGVEGADDLDSVLELDQALVQVCADLDDVGILQQLLHDVEDVAALDLVGGAGRGNDHRRVELHVDEEESVGVHRVDVEEVLGEVEWRLNGQAKTEILDVGSGEGRQAPWLGWDLGLVAFPLPNFGRGGAGRTSAGAGCTPRPPSGRRRPRVTLDSRLGNRSESLLGGSGVLGSRGHWPSTVFPTVITSVVAVVAPVITAASSWRGVPPAGSFATAWALALAVINHPEIIPFINFVFSNF